MASRISCTAHIFRHVKRPVTPFSRLHDLSRIERPSCESANHFTGRHLGSTIQRKYAGEYVSRSQDFRYINFPNTRKGRKAEREAYEYWASFWRSAPQVEKPLVFKIDERDLSDSSGLIDVSREGITFPAGDRRGEGYWRLEHPLSLLARLHESSSRLRSRLALLEFLVLRLGLKLYEFLVVRSRIWLYGGPSLPLRAKLKWLVNGPSSKPWSKRSRWIRWPTYALFCTIIIVTMIILRLMEKAPLTGRWRINFKNKLAYAKDLQAHRDSELEMIKKVFLDNPEPLVEPDLSRVNAIFQRILLACGLENTVWEFYLMSKPGKHHDIACVPVDTCYYVSISIMYP